MRLFVAVELPDAVRTALREGLGRLKRDLPAARWVRVEGMHLTLKFLGEQDAGVCEALASASAPAFSTLAPVEVRLGGGGFFPNAHRARVAWVGGQAPGLDGWARALEAAAERLGIAREERPFAVHLTLARLERPWGERAIDTFVHHVSRWSLPPFVAREAVVFRSELKPSGADYTAVLRIAAGA
ncbi:MAG: RNA 2',3'-cyclic phosphodiesterase [Acidobacteriota bacterium]